MNPLKVCPQCGTEYPANARFCEIDGTALRSAGGEQDMVGSIIAERYHVMKKLGEGGMGQVYLVEHVKMGRKSALKVMHPGMVKDVDAISRFNREAANASRISHPNVAAVYDFGETADGVIFLAMEFVDGPPLTKVIEQAGALPAKRAAEIVRQTSDALAVAHDLGIVHRDLKPDNIMVAKTRDGGDIVKVVDFGIAKAANSEAQKVTKTGLVVGTPEYMSPEQLAGDKLDGRSDIYALGLVAFNMLTGKLPFPSESAQESMIMRLTDRPKTLADMRPDVSWSAEVQAALDKALERDVTGRYQNATEFGRDLQRAIDRMPETVAAELGTQMIAVPPTRVASNAGAPQAEASIDLAATVAAPASKIAEPVTQAAAPAKKKNMLLLIGGPFALVAVAAVAMIAANGSAKDSGAKTDPPVVVPQPQNTGSSTPASPDTGTGTKTPNPGGSGTPVGPKPAGNPGPASTVNNIPQTLAKLLEDAPLDGKAKGVLGQIDGLLPRITAANDSAEAYAVRYRAYVTLEKPEDACRAIQEAIRLTKDQVAKGRYERRAEGCGG